MYSLLLFLHSFPFSSPSSSFTVLPSLAFLPLPLLRQDSLLFSPLSSSSSYSSSSFFNPFLSCIHQVFFLLNVQCPLLVYSVVVLNKKGRLKRDSNPRPSSLKASTLPMGHQASGLSQHWRVGQLWIWNNF